MNRIAALVAIAFLTFLPTENAAAAPARVKVGISLPLSGNSAFWGTDLKNGMLFANDDLAQGRYEFVIEDDRCSSKDAVSIAHKFINVDKIKWVLGFGCTGALLSAAPLYEKAGVMVISPGTASVAVSKAGDFIFRTWPSDANLINLLYNRLAGRHRMVGILSEQTEYAQSVAQAFKDKSNTSVTSPLTFIGADFIASQSDFRPELMRLKKLGIEALFINSQDEFVFYAALKQARALNPMLQIYGTAIPGSAGFLERAGRLADGIVFADVPAVADLLQNETGRLAYQRFLKKYGQPVGWDTGVLTGYEAVRALDAAVRAGQEPRAFLYRTQFQGLFGKWHFDENGDIQGLAPILKQVRCSSEEPFTCKGERFVETWR